MVVIRRYRGNPRVVTAARHAHAQSVPSSFGLYDTANLFVRVLVLQIVLVFYALLENAVSASVHVQDVDVGVVLYV